MINKDQAIGMAAVTNDGVVTIKQSLIAASTVPTFTTDSTTSAAAFGLANGYFFIYIKGSVTIKVTFTEATTGYQYMKNITVNALNQYDLSPIINSSGVVKVHSFAFSRSNNSQQ